MINGIVLTLVALVGMIVWSLHEIRRIDQIIGAKSDDDTGEPAREDSG